MNVSNDSSYDCRCERPYVEILKSDPPYQEGRCQRCGQPVYRLT